MADVDSLIRRVFNRANDDNGGLPAPVDADRIVEAESQLGFALHPLLARLYRDVGDGGFGPDYRLLPLLGPGSSVVGEYLARRERSISAENPGWPEGLVPILTWGCAMYAAVDCRSEDGQVLLFEPNAYSGGAWDECWFRDAESLVAWLEAWLHGTGWAEVNAQGIGDFVELELWEQAGIRLADG
ncbi:SMI1/KNR4 family protein [Catenulispora rubra]|uniref:SMI1/KNR4 family protein n=1 Tax=Catenulispora rubra TaxID=280293 RepID=UPI0018925312|nr:SMI1/KNR4 family protein [Catenulispora rubra]